MDAETKEHIGKLETAIKELAKDNLRLYKRIRIINNVIQNQEKRIIWCEENLKIRPWTKEDQKGDNY